MEQSKLSKAKTKIKAPPCPICKGRCRSNGFISKWVNRKKIKTNKRKWLCTECGLNFRDGGRKVGRPPKSKEERVIRQNLTISLAPEEYQTLKEKAEVTGQSMTGLIKSRTLKYKPKK